MADYSIIAGEKGNYAEVNSDGSLKVSQEGLEEALKEGLEEALKLALEASVDTGTATGGSGTTIVDTTKDFTVDMWKNAIAEVVIDDIHYLRMVSSNTDDTITIAALPGTVVVAAGCSYSLKIPIAIQDIERWGGTQLTGRDISLDLQTLSAGMGTVVESPLANTLLDRVKALLTGIVLAAGTNLIGLIGIDQTGDNNKVNVTNFPATQPVSGTFWQTTQPVSLKYNQLVEQKTEADAVANVITFSDDIEAVEIYHDELTWQTFTVNGLTLTVPSGGYRTPIGGVAAATVTIPAGIDCIVGRLV